jgi:glycerol-3-phosphate cytidylyltransferase
VCPYDISTYGGLMIYCFDLDGTICTTDEKHDYNLAVPIKGMIEKINELYKINYIKIFTARGASSGIDWTELTKKQIQEWGIKHHELILNRKPSYDIFIDDKAVSAEIWRKQNIKVTMGIIAGSFDVIHPGYIKMFKDAKIYCDHLTIALQTDASIERPNKIKPILSYEDREMVLLNIRQVDCVMKYTTEIELVEILKNNKFDVRILGEDYRNKNITGQNLTEKIIFIDRKHGWSTTKFKEKIALNYQESLK